MPTFEDKPRAAIGFVCLATLCFVGMATFVKLLSAGLGAIEIIWGRYFFHLLASVLIFPAALKSLSTTPRRDLQIIRSFLVLGATGFAFVALRHIPLATMTAIGFVGPVLVVTLASVVLKERVSTHRWVAVVVGFLGVVIILRPGYQPLHWPMLLPIAMAACYASYQIMTRIVRGLASPQVTLIYSAVVGTIATSILLPFVWQTPSQIEWLQLVMAGILGCGGHLALIKAYELAPASFAAPFVYSELLWASILGWLVFAEMPDVWTWLGAAVLVSAGIYLLRTHER